MLAEILLIGAIYGYGIMIAVAPRNIWLPFFENTDPEHVTLILDEDDYDND